MFKLFVNAFVLLCALVSIGVLVSLASSTGDGGTILFGALMVTAVLVVLVLFNDYARRK